MRTDIKLEKALEFIANDSSVHFIEDIICDFKCAPATFYSYIPVETNEMNAIKEALLSNRSSTKRELRTNWKDDQAPAATQIALYKLIGTPDEREVLNGTARKEESNSESEEFVLVRGAYEEYE